MSPALLLTSSIATFLQIYIILIIIRILLTWFPTVDVANQLAGTLSQVTDPYLNIFRSIIPPLAGLDFSPVIAIMVLQLLQQMFSSVTLTSGGF